MGVSPNKKSKSLKYFILITVFPIVWVSIIFLYALSHVQKDVDFTSSEIKGMNIIKHIENIVFDLQRIRGLKCIVSPDSVSKQDVEKLQDNILNKLYMLNQEPLLQGDNSDLIKELFAYTNSINKSIKDLKNVDYEYLSTTIKDLMTFSNRISYNYKLILDPVLSSYILIDNMVTILPQLIEQNGKIRAIASGIKSHILTDEQKETIIIQLHNIQNNLRNLNYNISMLHKETSISEVSYIYANMIKAQKTIIDFANKKLLQSKSISIEANGIFELTTKNIDKIIELYNVNYALLDKLLQARLSESKRLSLFIILTGLISISIIIYINMVFYQKNEEFVNKIQKLTITDHMTSLYNRRHFDKEFEKYVKTNQRTNQLLIFIILDIDFFKEYNDTYGHDTGDDAIKAVAKVLKESLQRANDMAFRLGGEEFGILCTESDKTRAVSFAQSIKNKIESEKIEHKKNTASEYLTVSMGVFAIESEYAAHTTKDIYRFADQALYKAKENGRNNIVFYGEENVLLKA